MYECIGHETTNIYIYTHCQVNMNTERLSVMREMLNYKLPFDDFPYSGTSLIRPVMVLSGFVLIFLKVDLISGMILLLLKIISISRECDKKFNSTVHLFVT